jgi:class 3 adenylate cyclase/HAMP domain-containing protein
LAVPGNRISAPTVGRKISTLLLLTLTTMAGLVLVGLIVMSIRLLEIQTELATLRNSALPRLVKLAQLSQDASATSAIAPALSAVPARSEFETLLSRIKDKESSQSVLLDEIASLFNDNNAAQTLRNNQKLLIENLQQLTGAVREQIELEKKLETRTGFFRKMLDASSVPINSDIAPASGGPESSEGAFSQLSELTGKAIFEILNSLLDSNGARFGRNRKAIEDKIGNLSEALSMLPEQASGQLSGLVTTGRELVQYWASNGDAIYADKQASLSNSFKIKALAEENSLIANRLLSSAGNEFRKATDNLEAQIRLANETTRFTIISILVVIILFAAGNFVVWSILRRRVFKRLDRIRDALEAFAENRAQSVTDPIGDEIGEISQSLNRYMDVIDDQETELAKKTGALEGLSKQLAKYLSPQVYDSIFSGKQEVKVASTRKKLTVFFSDIAGFTATADKLESEELTQLLNHYLTEMSRIALNYGGTVDKYVGDAILIFFGDPDTKGAKNDALACVRMAIAMRQRMSELESTWRDLGIENPLRIRMGINTGFCTVGNFGSEDRLDYTIIGGAVNTASRLENAAAPGEILISYATFALVKDQVRCEEKGPIEVKGIAYPIATYTVVGSNDNIEHQKGIYSEDSPNIKIELDFQKMSDADRTRARTILKEALSLFDIESKSAKRRRSIVESRVRKRRKDQ